MRVTDLRTLSFLGLVFSFGLLVGYVFHTNPGYNRYFHNTTSGAERYVAWPLGQVEMQKVPVPQQSQPRMADYARFPRVQIEAAGVVYDCVTWKVLYRYDVENIYRNYRVIPKIIDTGEADDHRQNAFVDIFNKQTWGGREAGVAKDNINYKASGPGSALEKSQGVVAILHIMIDRMKTNMNKTVIKILDLPCGDLQYMSHFLKTRTDIDYTGADIVPELIAKHRENYEGQSNIHFKHMDIVKDKLNDSYDIIICRMMLQHLVHNDVLKALYHFSSSNSTYLAASTFSDNKVNQEVRLADTRFRHLNLETAPVNLSPPVCTYKEPIHTEHYMAIWKLPLLRHV